MKLSLNKNIKCLIIDDEVAAQKVLQHFIKETAGLKLELCCSNTAQAFDYLQSENSIDLLFLDINMPEESGIAFYKRLINPPQVIFTTAYSEYAIQGFELEATDYLLKPISYNRFLKAIEKASQKLGSKYDFLMLNENKVMHKIFFHDILYAEAAGDYVKVFTQQKMVMTHSTFQEFNHKLNDQFLRIHKSFIINKDRIEKLEGNQLTIEGHQLPVGLTYKDQLLKSLQLK